MQKALVAIALGLAACTPADGEGSPAAYPSLRVTSATMDPAPPRPTEASRAPATTDFNALDFPPPQGGPPPPPVAPLPPPNGPLAEPWRDDLVQSALELHSLTPDQKSQIEALARRRETQSADVRSARAALIGALADQLGIGNVSASYLAPDVQRLASAIQSREPADREVLENLHAVLTGGQRRELVRAAEAHLQTMQGQDGEEEHPQLGWFGRNVELTRGQETQIETALRRLREPPEDARADAQDRYTRLLEAFKGNTFVMTEAMRASGRDTTLRRVGSTVRVAEAVAPVLTAEQRAAAAAALKETLRETSRP